MALPSNLIHSAVLEFYACCLSQDLIDGGRSKQTFVSFSLVLEFDFVAVFKMHLWRSAPSRVLLMGSSPRNIFMVLYGAARHTQDPTAGMAMHMHKAAHRSTAFFYKDL